jgi:hypothetical protein
VWIGAIIVVASGLLILYREVVHKGRQVRLSMYGLTPIRPTQADLKDQEATGRGLTDVVNESKIEPKDKGK